VNNRGWLATELWEISEFTQLDQHLTELLEAINTEANMPPGDKDDATESVGDIAAAAEQDDPAQKQTIVQKATRTPQRIAQTLPDATKFADALSRLIPLITGLF
jgi:hypothetical protein